MIGAVRVEDGIPVLDPMEVPAVAAQYRIIDVRRPDEYVGELGHIEGAELITLGDDLQKFLEKTDRNLPVLFVCRSGARSGHATLLSRQMGFTQTVNMYGGMILWNQAGLPVRRDLPGGQK